MYERLLMIMWMQKGSHCSVVSCLNSGLSCTHEQEDEDKTGQYPDVLSTSTHVGTSSNRVSEHESATHHDNENDYILDLNHTSCYLDGMFPTTMDVDEKPTSSYQ
ncbi:hypothetical protein PR048_003936, partial [Dryococelus australis]